MNVFSVASGTNWNQNTIETKQKTQLQNTGTRCLYFPTQNMYIYAQYAEIHDRCAYKDLIQYIKWSKQQKTAVYIWLVMVKNEWTRIDNRITFNTYILYIFSDLSWFFSASNNYPWRVLSSTAVVKCVTFRLSG